MSLLTNVHAENRSERRLSVFIFNLIIFVMSILILVAYATQPFFSVKATAEFTKEQVTEFVKFENEEIDVTALVNEGVALELDIVVPASVVLDTAASVLNRMIFHFDMNADLNDTITALVDDNIDLLIEQLFPTIENIAVNAAKQLAVTKGKDILRSTLSITSEELENRLADVDIDEEIDSIVEAIRAENATTESVAQAVVDAMNDAIGKLEPTDTPTINTDELRANVIASLATFAKEDGSIDFDEAIANIFNNMFTTVSETVQTEKEATSVAIPLNEEQADAVSELKLNLRNKVLSALGEDVHRTVGRILKLSSLLLIFSMATWIYLMIKILVKLFNRDNTVKFKVPILFGGLPGLLWLIPSIALHFISKNPTAVANPYNLDPSFAASGWVAILGVLVLIIISAPYGALRNELRGKKLRKFK